jgi:hypothetical protein
VSTHDKRLRLGTTTAHPVQQAALDVVRVVVHLLHLHGSPAGRERLSWVRSPASHAPQFAAALPPPSTDALKQ